MCPDSRCTELCAHKGSGILLCAHKGKGMPGVGVLMTSLPALLAGRCSGISTSTSSCPRYPDASGTDDASLYLSNLCLCAGVGLCASPRCGGGPRDGDAATGRARPTAVGHPLLYRSQPGEIFLSFIFLLASVYLFFDAAALRAQWAVAVAARRRRRRVCTPRPPAAASHAPHCPLRRP